MTGIGDGFVAKREAEEATTGVLRLRSRFKGEITGVWLSVDRFRLSRLVAHSTSSGLSRIINDRVRTELEMIKSGDRTDLTLDQLSTRSSISLFRRISLSLIGSLHVGHVLFLACMASLMHCVEVV